MTDDQKAAAYYKAAMLKEAPPFVPARVRVLKEQFGDGPFRGAGVPAGEHDCRCNKWGTYRICLPCIDKWIREIEGDDDDE